MPTACQIFAPKSKFLVPLARDRRSSADLLRSSDVRSTWNAWITQLVANYSIDGLRIDSAKDQEQSFYAGFLAAAGVYAVGEVADGDPAYVAPYQNYIDGVLDYPRCVVAVIKLPEYIFWLFLTLSEATTGSRKRSSRPLVA